MKWFLIALAIAVLSVALNLPLMLYAVAIAAATYGLTRTLAIRWSQQVIGERNCDRVTVRIGDRVAVEVNLRNRGPLPIPWLLIEDLLPVHHEQDVRPRLEIDGTRVIVAKLAAGRAVRLAYAITCRTRGFFQIGPTVCETGDFFGLQRRFRVVGEPHYLLVYPKVISVEGYDIQSRRPIGEVVMSHRLFEDPTRISGIRQYQMGDPLARIHWRATARTNTLQSKQFQPSSLTGATIVLDFHRSAFDRRHEPLRSELAVTAAASIAHAIHEMGQQLGMVSNATDAADRIRQTGWVGDWRTRDESRRHVAMQGESHLRKPIVIPTRKSADQISTLMETLARVELSDALELSEMIVETSQRMPADATVLAIVSSITLQTAVALGLLRKRGFAVTAIVNSHDAEHFVRTSGLLWEQGIESHQLRDEESITWICRSRLLAGR